MQTLVWPYSKVKRKSVFGHSVFVCILPWIFANRFQDYTFQNRIKQASLGKYACDDIDNEKRLEIPLQSAFFIFFIFCVPFSFPSLLSFLSLSLSLFLFLPFPFLSCPCLFSFLFSVPFPFLSFPFLSFPSSFLLPSSFFFLLPSCLLPSTRTRPA